MSLNDQSKTSPTHSKTHSLIHHMNDQWFLGLTTIACHCFKKFTRLSAPFPPRKTSNVALVKSDEGRGTTKQIVLVVV